MLMASLSLLPPRTHPYVHHAYVPLEPIWFKPFVSSWHVSMATTTGEDTANVTCHSLQQRRHTVISVKASASYATHPVLCGWLCSNCDRTGACLLRRVVSGRHIR